MTRLALLTALLVAASAQAQTVPVTTDSETARDHYSLALQRVSHVDMDGARAHLDAALDADPEFALAHVYRAWLSPPADRDEHLRRAQAARPSAAERRIVEAYAAHHDGDHDREIEVMEALYEAHPDDGDVATWLGNELYFGERYDEAAAVLRQALAANPGDVAALNMLGYALKEAGDAAGAEAAFLDYILAAPHEGNPYDSYGEFLLGEGRIDEAEVQFTKALARDPDLTASQDQLVEIAIRRANRTFEQAVASGDAEAVAALYTAGAVAYPPDAPPVRGREAIGELFASIVASGVDGVTLETHEVRSVGTMALEFGTGRIRAGGEDGDPFSYSVLWAKDGDQWRLHRDIWNSDGPQTATASN